MAPATTPPATGPATGPTPDPATPPAIELRGIDKRFGPVEANRDISLRVARGTIHGLVGENGAGKSTLVRILYGFYQADAGEIRIHGQPCRIRRPEQAIALGIGMVHQHFMLVDRFTVLENVILGAEGSPWLRGGLARARATLARLARDYGLAVDPDAVAGTLPVGLRQRLEILKALFRGADILILDEPTGVLTPQEADHLFRVLVALREQGKTILLITHKLREIMAVTQTVTVMRAGRVVASPVTAETGSEALAEAMVGRKVLLRVGKKPARPGKTRLAADNITVIDQHGVTRVKHVDLAVRAGEIVGIAGVAGNGQSALLAALAGMCPVAGGRIRIGDRIVAGDGIPAGPDSPRQRRAAGLAHVPEDRQRHGLVMDFAARDSAILGYHHRPCYNRGLLLAGEAIAAATADMMAAHDIRPPDPDLACARFSGGNQQKLVIAREMARNPDILLVGQPTRGVDIGAIEFIHRRLVALRDAGKAILLVSVELEEIMSLSDRILVMFDGRLVGAVEPAAATEQMLGLMMAGIAPGTADAAGQP